MDVSSLSDVLDATLTPPPPQSVLEDYMVSPYEVDTRAEAKIIDAYSGSERLVIGKHLYKNSGSKSGKRYWKCVEDHCDSLCHTVNGEIVLWKNTYHSHIPVHGKVAVEEALAEARRRATTTAESIQCIVEGAKLQVHTRHDEMLPKDDSLKRSLRRFRQRAGVRELDAFKTTADGDDFLRHQEEDLVVFAADVDLDILAKAAHWFADGTFKIAPRGYYQQYTLHAYSDGVMYPCVYALLPGKSEATYNRLLGILEPLFPSRPAPETILMDFEKAAMNAFSSNFPGAAINGCFFHLGQSVWRKIQAVGLQHRYMDDKAFAERLRRVLGLAFVPVDQVHHYMDLILAEEVPRGDRPVIEFLRYFRDTYVGQRIMTNGQLGTLASAQFPASVELVRSGEERPASFKQRG